MQQLRKELQASESSFGNIITSSPDGILVLDRAGTVLFANPAAETLLGLASPDLIGKSFGYPASAGERAEININRSPRERRVAEMRVAATEWEGKDALLATLRDITEHKQTETRLREGEARWETLFNNMTEGVILLSANGKILQTNTAALRLLGCKRGDLEGQDYAAVPLKMMKSDRTLWPVEERPISQIIEKGTPAKGLEMGMQRADGSISWFLVSVAPLPDKEDKLTGMVSVFVDITERRKLKDELEFYVAEVTRAQEEERKRIARELHDGVGQSLAGLCLEMDAAMRDLERSPEHARLQLKDLRTKAEGIVRELRIFSHQLRPGTLDHLSLSAALSSLIFEMNATGDVQASYEVTGPEQRLSAEIELTLFRITQEALNNVHKHSMATQVDVTLRYSQRKLTLRIADNGRGFSMPEEGSFATMGRLGLLNMRERARLIGASLTIKSTIHRGTVIVVELLLPKKAII